MLVVDSSVTVRLAEQQDLAKVKELLQNAHLPIEKIEDQFNNFILLFDDQSTLIGSAGLEIYADFGLIRSVAITKALQNKKLGSLLVDEIEKLAKKKHLTALYLLTETAEKFFTKHGYTVQQRENVPMAIQNSFEYATTCKISAIVMKKDL